MNSQLLKKSLNNIVYRLITQTIINLQEKVEYKYVTKQKSNYTTISKEYPKSVGDPYYPISTENDKKILEKYENEKNFYKKNNLYFVGRLAEYKYINTDQAIEKGMILLKKF